jgi:hypothetical protein
VPIFTDRRRRGQSRLPIHDATAAASRPAHSPHHHFHHINEAIVEMASGRAPSQTPVPTTETAESVGASSTVSAAEWEGMSSLLKNVYDYRDAESVFIAIP